MASIDRIIPILDTSSLERDSLLISLEISYINWYIQYRVNRKYGIIYYVYGG